MQCLAEMANLWAARCAAFVVNCAHSAAQKDGDTLTVVHRKEQHPHPKGAPQQERKEPTGSVRGCC